MLGLEREYALLKIEFEELEIKFNEVKDINIGLDEKTDELFQVTSEHQKM